MNGSDYPETVQVLDRKVNTARVLQFRALGALRTMLSEDGVG